MSPTECTSSRYGRETIKTFKLDQDSLLLRTRRTSLNDTETFLEVIAVLPLGDARRVAARGVFLRSIGDTAPRAAMIRTNPGDRIRAL